MITHTDETEFNKVHCKLVNRRHDELVQSGVNPDLAAVRHEVLRLDALRLSENQVAEYLNGEELPLAAGRRGMTGKSLQADLATNRAARASKLAEDSDDPDLHEKARQAHAEARAMHKACCDYHDTQANYHSAKTTPAEARAAGSPGLEAALEDREKIMHCPHCDVDFALESPDDRTAGTHVPCPNCHARLDIAEGTREGFDENGEPLETARTPNPYDIPKTLLCPNCHADYNLEPVELASDYVTCAKCGERINVSSALKERFNEDGEKVTPKTPLAVTPLAVETKREPQAMHPFECARALPSFLGDSVPDAIMYMPGGTFSITPSRDGKPCPVTLKVDKTTAERIEQQRAIMAEGGNKPFFSIEHGTDLAAFWPSRFFWAAQPDATGRVVQGVWAEGTWSQAGRDAIVGKNYRSFSPTFFVDEMSNDPDNPAQVVCNPDAALNLGALVNDPAFGRSMSPLWPDESRA